MQNDILITWHTLWVLLTSAFFHQKIATFLMLRNTYQDCTLYIISNSFNFSWVFSDFLDKHGYNFDGFRVGYSRPFQNEGFLK